MTEKYTVYFYHGTQNDFNVARKAKLQVLFDECCRYLHIEESVYFSLYVNDVRGKPIWLNTDKSIRKQLPATRDNIHFGVKYYHMDPTQLYSEETRLYFVHQVIDDIRAKNYPLNENQLNLITALYIQSELGDYEEGTNLPGYTKDFFLFDHQSPDREDEIVSQHKAIAGKPPAQCENEILRLVREQPLYGVHVHSGALQEKKKQHPVHIGIHPHGLRVTEDETDQVFDLPWDMVTKLETRRRRFVVRVRGKLPEKRDGSELLGREEADVTNAEPDEEVNTEPKEAEPDVTQDVETALLDTQDLAPSVQPAPNEVVSPSDEIAPVTEPVEPTPKPNKLASKSKKKEPVTAFKFTISDSSYAKVIWKLAVEHHYFFNRIPEKQPMFSFIRIGSRFHYTGRTFRQTQKEFSEKKFDPIDPDVRVRMSQRRRRHSGQGDETEDSAYPGYVKAKDSFRRGGKEAQVENPEAGTEVAVETKPVEVPEPGTAEAEMQKDVTDKFLDDEFQREAEKEGGDEPPAPPQPAEIVPVANGDNEMPDFPPPAPEATKEAAPEVIKVVETANVNSDELPVEQ